MSATTDKVQLFGVSAIWVRGSDGLDEQIEALQDCSLSVKGSLVELMGDDALVPLDVKNSKVDIDITGKVGKLSMKALQILNGGTLASISSDSISSVQQESDCSNMADNLTVVAGSGSKETETWLFTATAANTYKVTKQSTGELIGEYTTSDTPNTGIVTGCAVTVPASASLTVGATATVMTTGANGSIDHLTLGKTDTPSNCVIRCITEEITGVGRYEFTFYRCKSTGNVFPLKTKDFALSDFEFKVLWNSTLLKTLRVKRYVDEVACS
jgi:hypothetical protein